MTGGFDLSTRDAVDWLRDVPAESVDLLITDPAYESLEKHRAVGTTTRLKHSKASSNDWFNIFPNARFGELFAEIFRVLKADTHFYLLCDAETMFIAKPAAEKAGVAAQEHGLDGESGWDLMLATTEAISQAGARFDFVDIDPRTYNIDADTVAAAVTPRTRAIVPVHLFGQSAEMAPILAAAGRVVATVIEDACQATGAEYEGCRLGSMSRLTCFSFYPSKNLGALGDAGAVVAKDLKTVEHIRLRRDHGQTGPYVHETEGLNARMDSIQAAVLLVKLRHLDEWNATRRKHGRHYDGLLRDVEQVVTPPIMEYANPVYALYTIRARERDRLQVYLRQRGIGTGVYYPIPLHLQPAYQYLGYKEHDFPVAETAAREVLSLPMYAELREDEINRVVEGIRDFYRANG